jgi:hypothetical protein
MTLSIWGLMAGFILVMLLLGYLMLNTRLSVTGKLITVLVISGFYWVQYQSLLQFKGWPTEDALPANFILIATEVREPDKSAGDKGVMYWWVREGGKPLQPPRVYQLPYRAELNEKAQQVVQEQKQGAQYVGKSGNAADFNRGMGIRFEKVSKSSRHKKD